MKHAIAKQLYWEYKELEEQDRKLGKYKLPKPRQQGWLMELRLRDDIMRSSEAGNYLLILPHVQSITISRTTVFEEIPEPRRLPLQNKEKYGFPNFFWGKYFCPQYLHYKIWNGLTYTYPDGYKLQRPWVFEPIIKPRWIKELRIIDPAIESRMKEIRNKITNQNLNSYLKKKFNWWIGAGWCRCDYCMAETKQKELKRQMEKELYEELRRA